MKPKLECHKKPFITFSLQVRIQARDLGITEAMNRFLVCRLSVQQNFQAPFFVDQSYSQTVIETFTLGETILAVSARDNDPLVAID